MASEKCSRNTYGYCFSGLPMAARSSSLSRSAALCPSGDQQGHRGAAAHNRCPAGPTEGEEGEVRVLSGVGWFTVGAVWVAPLLRQDPGPILLAVVAAMVGAEYLTSAVIKRVQGQ